MGHVFAPQWLAFAVLVASALFVHLRGRARFRFARQLTDYSTFTAPINVFTYLFSAVPNRPMHNTGDFPELELLRGHWRTIRDEARDLYERGHIRDSQRHDDVIGDSLFKRGWKRFYVKWYGEVLPSAAQLCPQTVALLQQIPTMHGAMFSLLPPRSRLGRHRDPFAASLRYHLGLITPNSDLCRIYVDGEPYSWRDGEGVLFDETFVHWVENDTDDLRIILFCDLERPVRTRFARAVNRAVIRYIGPMTASRNVDAEEVGALNRLLEGVYPAHAAVRRLKERNRSLYYLLKYTSIGVALAAILFAV